MRVAVILGFFVLAAAGTSTGADSKDSVRRRDHWGFRTPVRPAVPAVKGQAWVRNPIDAFILARLEKEGLSPSPEADPTTLFRRLSLDMLGLPPSLEELNSLPAAPAADGGQAYLDHVERILASPHYGERWGRLWLDAARYADSDGYEKDKAREVWFYRDWVINALNRDLPYDRFIIDQIAGDLLPGATQDQIVATGFLRNSMVNEEGGVDPEQFRMEALFDRMDAIGKSVLGLTIQCAQCHDHKFDPLKQAEYYRLFAFINNDYEANIAVYSPEEDQLRAELFRGMRDIEAELCHTTPDWEARMERWEAEAKKGQPQWVVVRPEVEEMSNGGQKYLPLEDGSFLAQGYAPTHHRVHMEVKTDLPEVTAFRLEVQTDPNLPLGGPGRSIWGTYALTEFEVEAAPAGSSEKPAKVKIASATSDFELPDTPLAAIFNDKSDKKRGTGPVAYAIDGKEETAWGGDPGAGRRNQERKAVFVAETPIRNAGGATLHFYLKQNHGGWNSDDNQNHNLGRLRLSVTSSSNAAADPLPRGVREILAIPRESRSPAQVSAVFSAFRATVPEWREANEKIEALWRRHPAGSSQLVLRSRDKARSTHVLMRGDFLKPASPVRPGVPEFLHPIPESDSPTRLAFARWLVDRRSPTTARSIVNRIWQAYFGIGLVQTSEDLGSQSEAPSHPELLDWLAVEFMERGFGLKDLHRLIAGSATYRQSSRVTPDLLARDPYNRLLARGARFRVDAETVRDIGLAASGLLVREVGGPSVYPPLPGFMILPPVSYGPKIWKEESGPGRYRRALYIFRYRSLPYPLLQAFDAPNGDFSCVRRARSNTPLQALATLNEPVFVECARALARRMLEEGGANDAGKVAYAFRRCTARRPDPEESRELLALLEAERRRAVPGSDEGAGSDELASWTVVARVLLNLDETITRE